MQAKVTSLIGVGGHWLLLFVFLFSEIEK